MKKQDIKEAIKAYRAAIKALEKIDTMGVMGGVDVSGTISDLEDDIHELKIAMEECDDDED